MTVHEQITQLPHTADRVLDFHPGMGMRWEITHSAGELFQATNWLDPQMPGPPVHVHPDSAESFEVIEGTLDVLVDGEWSQLRAGERTTVPANVPHTLRNATDAPVTMLTIVEPAGRAEAFFRHMHRLLQDGRIRQLPPKDPRSAIYVAMLFCAYPDVIRTTEPPAALFRALARLGKVLGLSLES
jgi:quercetin dioxygenase-like cupin family protein